MGSGPILKTPGEIETMRRACEVTAEALRLAEEMVAPGVSTLEIDRAVEALIRKRGGVPAFLGYPSSLPSAPPFPGSICASINEEVVHGIPRADRILREGDVVSIDVGVQAEGFFGDAARTFSVGAPGRRTRKLLTAGAGALAAAIRCLRPQVPLSRVSRAIQEHAEAQRFAVVRQFVGHGIGRAMHEPPQVPNYVSRTFPERNVILETGAVLAIEPMLNAGTHEVEVLQDGWTVVTCDRKLSVHFEDTVAIGPEGPVVLTR